MIVMSNLFRGDDDDLIIPWISLVDDNHDDDGDGGGDDSDDHLVAWLVGHGVERASPARHHARSTPSNHYHLNFRICMLDFTNF